MSNTPKTARSESAYRSKRDFRKTPEPSGRKKKAGPVFKRRGNPIFVVQQHDANTMHWDFRLEVDGVLKSWAIPKGPSTHPKDKRLAVATEDHPLDDADFEGTILLARPRKRENQSPRHHAAERLSTDGPT